MCNKPTSNYNFATLTHSRLAAVLISYRQFSLLPSYYLTMIDLADGKRTQQVLDDGHKSFFFYFLCPSDIALQNKSNSTWFPFCASNADGKSKNRVAVWALFAERFHKRESQFQGFFQGERVQCGTSCGYFRLNYIAF